MATILEFPAPTYRVRVERCGDRQDAAEVVIFPGVRYERMADDPPARRGRRARQRDRLELED